MRIVKPSYGIESKIEGDANWQHIERAGRTAYKSEDKIPEDSAKKFVGMIQKRGHESVLEHYNVSVRVICDRGVTHEIVRHRLASYTQESTRYCNYGKDKFGAELNIIQPCFWSDEGLTHLKAAQQSNGLKCKTWKLAMESAERYYLTLIELGATPQEARSVLPNSLKTEIVMTCNLREWRHFFKLRAAKAAHPQMREIAKPMLKEFSERIPIIFDDLVKELL